MKPRFRKLGLTALLAAVIMVAVGVTVWPTPERAWAVDFDVILTVDWGDEQPYNLQARIRLYDTNMEPLTPWEALQANPEFTQWTTTLVEVSSQAVFYEISFDGGLFNWNPNQNPFGGELNWETQMVDRLLWCLGLP